MWPKVNTAFLVIHGQGQHEPYQALDWFVNGFWEWFNGKNQSTNIQWKHKLQRHDGRVYSYISLVPDSDEKPTLDFYEFYWDRYMGHDIDLADLFDYFYEVSSGAKEFYKSEDFDRVCQVEKVCKVRRFKEGWHVIRSNWRIGRFIDWLLRWALIHVRFEEGWHVIRSKRFIGQFIDWLLRWALSNRRVAHWEGFPLLLSLLPRYFRDKVSENVHDFVIYLNPNARWRHFDIRDNLLSGALEELRLLLRNDYEKIIIVGHSMGSVIAYDTLSRVCRDLAATDGITPEFAEKIAGLVTFGSPLDKIAFFYYKPLSNKNKSGEIFVQRQILNQRHGFKSRLLPRATRKPVPIEDPMEIEHPDGTKCRRLDNITWLNFWNPRDLAADCLITYDVDNIPLENKDSLKSEHTFYWSCPEMYEKIAEKFFK